MMLPCRRPNELRTAVMECCYREHDELEILQSQRIKKLYVLGAKRDTVNSVVKLMRSMIDNLRFLVCRNRGKTTYQHINTCFIQ